MRGTSSKAYDLEDRTLEFSRQVRMLVRQLRPTVANLEDARQLVRASGSVGANYIEANEALGKKDFLMRIKIARKEAKESRYWLRLIDVEPTPSLTAARDALISEATELMNILSAIFRNSTASQSL